MTKKEVETDVCRIQQLEKEVERLSGLADYLYEKAAYHHDNKLGNIGFMVDTLWKERMKKKGER